jgi:hypothetical protein
MTTIEYIKKRCIDTGCKIVTIYNGDMAVLNAENNANPTFAINEGNDVISNLDTFKENFSGVYTAFLRGSKGSAYLNAERIVFRNEVPNKQAEIVLNATPVNLQAEVQALLAEYRRQDELKDLQQQLLEARSQDKRLIGLITEIAQSLGFGSKTLSEQLKPVAQVTTINGTMDDELELSPEQEIELENSLDTIVQFFGVEKIISIANRIKTDETFRTQLKTYL